METAMRRMRGQQVPQASRHITYPHSSTRRLTLEVSGRCHELHEDTAPIRSGPLDRIVRRHSFGDVTDRSSHDRPVALLEHHNASPRSEKDDIDLFGLITAGVGILDRDMPGGEQSLKLLRAETANVAICYATPLGCRARIQSTTPGNALNTS